MPNLHTQTNENLFHRTSQPFAAVEEKNPRLLWGKQTRDSSSTGKTSNPQDYAPVASPKVPTTSIEGHLVALATQSKHPQSCRNSVAAAPTSIAPSRPAQATNTTFRDRRPNVPPLVVELQRRTTRLLTARAEQNNRSQATAAAPTHPGPPPRREVRPGRIDLADNPIAQATQSCHTSHVEKLPLLMELLLSMVPEAAASAYKH